ncbi:SPOR domain-containing protein [Natronohydrobacter thiooxidans]|uniref:SPOR domain-containing protein n=1 Tax=Natronohydrobacter thiooxidans TaxID=87172 RepID=UPI0008FF2185|nr:SPOR domain-containing protein [Natronohydrobacter thiooxidans]
MQTSQYRFLGLAVVVSISLAGCMDGSGSRSGTNGNGAARSAGPMDRDIEDPRVFSKRENGLWDGRPSLGGVWVAHPDVRSPERVIIRNTENGQETIGALFRRERMNPGPSFQVSGEAANAVGMLAGAPTVIEVVALRTEEAQPVMAEAPADALQATDVTGTEVAAAQPGPAPQPVAPGEAEGDFLIAMPEEDAASAPRREGGFFGRVFGRRSPQPAPAMESSAIATQVLGDAQAAPAATLGAEPEPAAQAPVAAPPAPASTLAQPYIQLGIFSVQANARKAESMAAGAGLSARIVPGQASGNQFWRVVVGPASTQAEHSQMLARVKGLGFNDAYAVRR